MPIDFEDDAVNVSVDEAGLSRLAKQAALMIQMQERKSELEEEIKAVEQQIREIEEQQIPAIMAELGVRSYELDNGASISVKKYYGASISELHKGEAFEWLIENGHGDLIKNVVSASFVRGQEDVAERFAQELEDRNMAFNTKKWVEPMTLKAFVKEQVETGKEIPSEVFGLYIAEKAKIETKKRTKL
jgi:hypothetical protein